MTNEKTRSRQRAARRIPKSLQWEALYLEERLKLVREHKIAPPSDAEERLRAYTRAGFPRGAEATLDAWLRVAECTPEEMASALSRPPNDVLTSAPPQEWQTFAAEVLSLRSLESAAKETQAIGTYRDLLQPFFLWGARRAGEIVDAIEGNASIFDRMKIVQSTRANLAARLIDYAGRAITLELHIQKLLDRIAGDTGTERFRSFSTLLRSRPRMWQRFFYRYPVLTRLLATYCLHWQRNLDGTLRSLASERPNITSELLGGKDPGRVVHIEAALGDLHAGGREVLLIRFEGGAKLIYKPRDLSVDVVFRAAFSRINAQGFEPRFEGVRVVVDAEHGWTEFIEHVSARNEQGIRDYYRRQGGYLALLWLFSGTDFHTENLIASGDQPMLIDLEALFHRRIQSIDERRSVGQRALDRSVMRTGMLPGWSMAAPDQQGVDVSGLGGREGQVYPHEVELWEGGIDDDPRLVRRKIDVPVRANRPLLDTTAVDVLPYEEDLVGGFLDATSLIQKNRDEWRQQIRDFSSCEVREVIRATFIYLKLVRASSHPDYLRDALIQESLFARTCNVIATVPEMKAIAMSEIRDMREGDIPRFASRPGGKSLFHAREGEFDSFFDHTAIDQSMALLESMNESEVGRQVRAIRGSLAILPREQSRPVREVPAVAYDESAMIDAAKAVGDELIPLAVRHGNEIEWLGLEERTREQTHFAPTGNDLYSGSSGIGIFMVYLYKATKEQRYLDCASAVVADLAQKLDTMAVNGGYSGLGSVVHFLHHYAVVTGDRSLMTVCVDLIAGAGESVERDQLLDIIAGSAGLLLVLLNVLETMPDERLRAMAVKIGEHLVARQTVRDCGGAAWDTIPAEAPLTGFAHGATGIAYSLARLADATAREDFRTAAHAAVLYERAVYIPQIGNWPDFRRPTAAQASMGVRAAFAWCHGAPGIALGRLKGRLHDFDDDARREVDGVLSQLQRIPLSPEDSLCHGELGNLETLIVAAQTLGRPDLLEKARHRAQGVIATNSGNWNLRSRGELVPGLLTGLAGVGMGFLRIARPDRVPSVLTLDGPIVQ